MNDPISARAVFAGLAAADLSGAQRGRQVLYHGTIETFTTDLEAGPDLQLDGLLWTAPSAAIAQTYIPIAGSEIGIGFRPYELDDRVRPPYWRHGQSHLFMIACAMHGGVPDHQAEYDRNDVIRSWRLPAGFPTQRDVADFLRRQGYGFSAETGGDGFIRGTERDGLFFVRPAAARDPGRLFIVLPPEDLRVRDLRRGPEGDLQCPDHRRYSEFAQAIQDGIEAVAINDFCQTRSQGNVGHIAYGLTAAGLARCQWFEVPAANFDPGHDNVWPADGVTDELRAAIETMAMAPEPG